MRQSWDVTPSDVVLHRILQQPQWEDRPYDGDLGNRNPNGGVRMLTKQPRPDGQVLGISLFTPGDQTQLAYQHQYLARERFGCVVTIPNVALPEGLQLIPGCRLKLRSEDEGVAEYGEHWQLYAAEEMSTDEFDAKYQEFINVATRPCNDEVAAHVDLRVDFDYMPGDRLTRAAVLALDALALNVEAGPSTRFFANVFSLDLRARDQDYTEVLKSATIANMLAAAFDSYVVHEPYLRAHVEEAQHLLSKLLDDYTPKWPQYTPYWEAHP